MKKINLIEWLSRNSHEKQSPQRFARYAAMLFMLLTLGVGQMWANTAGYVGNGESYYKNYLEYSKDGGAATQFKVDGSNQADLALGVVTSLTLTQYGVGMYQDADNLNGYDSDKFCYWIHKEDDSSESWTEVTGNWNDWNTHGWSGGWRHPGFGNNNLGIDVLSGLGAGKYKLTFYFKHQGNGTYGNAWLYLSNGGSNYNITFTINPVVTFKANGGTGSDYTQTVTYNTNTALTANTFTKTGYNFAGWATSSDGSVVYANSANVKLTAHTNLFAKWTATITPSAKYTNDGSSYTTGTTGGTVTINGNSSATDVLEGATYSIVATPAAGYMVESVDVGSTNIYSNTTRATGTYNNSLQTADAAATVTVKFAKVKDITVYVYVGDKNTGDVTAASVEMNGCTPYVGGTACSAQKVNVYTGSAPKFTLTGNWLTYTFTNVTKVTNITCARSGGNIFTGTITADKYIMYDGTALTGQCVPYVASWSTAPANGAVGGNMTAAVNTSGLTSPSVTWSSSNTDVATVNSSTGYIQYVTTGSARITASISWSAGNDYCAGSTTKYEDISVTSGATVSATRTSPAYVPSGVNGQVSMHITFTGTSSGWKYRVKHNWDTGYETAWLDASGSSADWTMTGGIGAGAFAYVVELYNSEETLIATSDPVSVTGETAFSTTIVAAGSNGSVSPSGTVYANNDHVHPSITATPSSNYHFVNWTSDNNTYASVADDDETTTTVTARESGHTITANFAGDQYSITYKDQGDVEFSGNHVDSPSHPTTHTYGTSTTLNSATKTGYSFGGWFTTSNCASGTDVTSLGATAYTSNITLYAKWTEIMSDLSTSCSYDAGTPGYAAPTVSNSATDVGYATTRTITATAAGTGYTFAGWTLTNCTRTDGGGPTANPITICSNGDGAAVSVVANYNEDLSSPWTLKGGTNLTGNDWATAYNLTKKSGHSTESIAYYTLSISSTNTGISGSANNWSFKLINSGTWYGLTADGSWWWQRTTGANKSLTTTGQNIQICADVAGNYEVKVDYSTPASPTVTVIFPTSYTLTYSIGDVNGTSGSISTSPSTESGSKVLEGSSITLTAPATKTGYTWKGWYTNAAGTEGKITDTNRAITVTMDADKTLYACYTEDMHTVTVTTDGHGTITTPASGTPRTVSAGIVTGASIATSANTGYTFYNWTKTSGSGTVTFTDANTASTTVKATSDATIQANFVDTWNLKGSEWNSWGEYKPLTSTGKANEYSTTLTLTKGTDYSFKVVKRNSSASVSWYGNANNAGDKAFTRGMSAFTTTAEGSNNNLKVTPDVTGDYIFTINTSGSTPVITVSYPEAYTVTYGAGTINGSNSAISVSPSFTSGDYVLPETDITFSKGTTKDGYTWKGWYSNVGGTGDAWSTTDASLSLTDTRTSNISVYACYSLNNYTITYNLNGGTNHPSNPANFNVETSTITLQDPTKTGYTFRGWYTDAELETEGSTIAIGTYANQEFWAKWEANTYTITLNQNGATTESTPTSLTATYDGRAGGASDQFTLTNPEKTGYTFAGWYENEGGSGAEIITTAQYYKWEDNPYVTTTGLWQHDGNVTVYAKWTPNDYAVTLSTTSETGYGSNAPANQTATYGAAMPTITLPVGAPGYKFQGYFTAANGAGTQYYNADGTSAHEWDIASATTLHAYFQKTVISTLEHSASIAKGDVVTLDVNPVLNQTGATDYMDICWSLLYDNDNPVESGVAIAANPVDGKPNQVRYTLTGLSAGYYKVKAVLNANASSFDACDAGTELSTLKSNLRIAGNSNVTILYQDASGNTIRENGAVEVARGETVEVTAPEIIGYSFATWVLGDVLATEDALTDNPITISAEYDGILIAKYNRKNTIYFKNTLNWPAVYVNLLSSGFWNANGSGNTGHTNRNIAMTQLGTSDIWYYEYGETSTSDYVSFTSQPQANATNFWGKDTDPKVMVVYPTRPNYDANERTAYGFHVNTPMFVPLAGQTAVEKNINNNGRAYYYNQGYWAKYEPINKETGYTLKIYNKKNNAATPDAGNAPVLVKSVPFVFDGDMTFPVSVTVDLEAGKWYGFKLYRDKGNEGDALSWYGNSGNMSNQHSGDFGKGETAWEFKTTLTANCGLKTNSAGDYVFTLTYGKEAYADSMQYLIGVHYPEATGDYRLVYSDDNRPGVLSTTIPFNSEHDTVSFFINEDANPVLKMQKCEVSYSDETSTVVWTDTIANLFSGGLPSAITKSGVYYFCINRNASGKKELGDVKLYTGNFYIRTDGATPSKWDNFRQNNHLMAYSDYADQHEDFTHSYTQWYDLTNRKNVKFTVANDYSVSISDTLTREALSGQWTNIDDYIDENGDLNRQANVRFMYNEKTNAISRAYIDGAYADGGNFLKILARTQDSIYAAAEGGAPVTEVTFIDDGNWLYEKTVYAQPGARYKLRSLFGETGGGKEIITQYFKGGAGSTAADSATMIGGKGSSRMQIRLLYDFKTNRVVTAYQPAGTINENLAIHADIMFMREHQEDIEQITFASGKSISEIENIYCGLRFNKWTLNNKSKEDGHATLSPLLSRYERDIFYVSFPYDVRLSDVIGFGTYGQHWIVEYYDGAARAKNGFWADSETYWKFVTPSMKDTFELKAGTGYIVALDLDELYYISDEVHAKIWDNTDITNLELLFPGKVSSISDIDVTYNMPTHQCTINRGTTAGDRRIKDSHWNVLGVPTFKNITGAETVDGGGSGAIVFANTAWIKDTMNLKFIYDGNLSDNSLTAKAVKGFEFQAMHAYVVQYCGNVTFTTSATPAPASVAARTYAEVPQEVDFRLELNKDGVLEDQTFVSLSNDENASAGFVFGEDLSKEFNNSRANIYTFIGTEWAAGNTLPMSDQTTVVPVGIKIASTGDYTFAIPEGTNGVGVTLIDNETGVRTSLSALDYTINLSAGTYDNRFVLEISPVHQSPTGVELLNGENGENGVRKVLIDNILYIVKDGVMYDAQGKRLQ